MQHGVKIKESSGTQLKGGVIMSCGKPHGKKMAGPKKATAKTKKGK